MRPFPILTIPAMKDMTRLLMLMTGVLLGSLSYGQDSVKGEPAFNLDPLLYNGVYYSYHVPSTASGSPYFNGPDFVDGAVRLRGVRYDHLALQYDMLHQQLVLRFLVAGGGVKRIVISEAWLESFDLQGAHFEYLNRKDTLQEIFQVIGTHPVRVAYSWSVEMRLNTRTGAQKFDFSKPVRTAYLITGKGWFPYRSNKEFAAGLNEHRREEIRQYLSQHKIRVRRISDTDLEKLLDYSRIHWL